MKLWELPVPSPQKKRKVKKMDGELANDEGFCLKSHDVFRKDCLTVFDRIIMEINVRSETYKSINEISTTFFLGRLSSVSYLHSIWKNVQLTLE